MKPIKFRYVNWRGDEHTYLMMPEPNLTYGCYQSEDEDFTWLISGHVSERDGESHVGRRTFKLTGMKDIELA